VVFSVDDLDATERHYRQFAGWEVLHRGRTSSRQAVAWSLAESTPIDEVLFANPGEQRGFVRLVKFHGVEQRQIRSSARFWDVGGFSNVSSRVLSMSASFGELQRRGWVGHHDPVRYRFGPFTVIEGVATGHDGVVFSLVERLEPKLDSGAFPGHVSAPFNAPQVVRDFRTSLGFFEEQLGFQVALETEITWQRPGANIFGLPYGIAMETPVKVAIVQPRGEVMGCLELFAPGELIGRDFSDRAAPPNLGILTVRFPVTGLADYARAVESAGVELAVEPIDVPIEPYGRVTMFAVRSPDGAWIEFYETA
jgi:catechol 2,3-dioxygenase-like lactoylglutathione lyase family enzyme